MKLEIVHVFVPAEGIVFATSSATIAIHRGTPRHVFGAGPAIFVVLHVLDLLTILESVTVGDGGEVAEDVLAAALGGDEAYKRLRLSE